MRALVLRAPRQFAVEDVPVPAALDPDDVLCKVHTTFICGTDPHIINGDYPGLLAAVVPVHPGPRMVGGSGGEPARARRASAGRPAIASAPSRTAAAALPQLPARPLQPVPELRPARDAATGSTATSRRAPTPTTCKASVKSLVRVPDGFDLELSACVDPLSIALYTVKRSRLQPGDDLLVMGTGPQGLMAILVGKALGAGRILAVGSGARLALAEDARRAADRLSPGQGRRAHPRADRRPRRARGPRMRRHRAVDPRLLPGRGEGRRRLGDRHPASRSRSCR